MDSGQTSPGRECIGWSWKSGSGRIIGPTHAGVVHRGEVLLTVERGETHPARAYNYHELQVGSGQTSLVPGSDVKVALLKV